MIPKFWMALTVAALFALPVQAQKIKATGASAAGVCAGALELGAGITSRTANSKPAAVINMQRARDFFAEMPQFDNNEIAANATGFIRFMNERMAKTTTNEQRNAISQEILNLAKKCFESAQQYAVPANRAAPPVNTPPAPQPLQVIPQ